MATEITTANAQTLAGIRSALQIENAIVGGENMTRTRAQLMKVARAKPNNQPDAYDPPPRCVLLGIGDSLAARFYANVFPVLQSEHGYGGFFARPGISLGAFQQTSTSTIVNDDNAGPYTSPFGTKEVLSSGDQATYSIGTGTSNSWTVSGIPNVVVGATLTDVVEIVVYYNKSTAAGHFKVQTSSNGTTYSDVTGASDIDAASGATTTLELGVLRLTGLDLDVNRFRFAHVSGNDVEIFGFGILRDRGVVAGWFDRGGMQMGPVFDDPGSTFSAVLEDMSPDAIFLTMLDSDPADGSHETYITGLLDDFDTAWGLMTNEPDIVYIGPNFVDGATTKQDVEIRLFRERAKTNAKTFVDIAAMLGSYANANALGLMADTTHPHPYTHMITATRFFEATGLGGWPGSYVSQLLSTLSVGTANSKIVSPAESTVYGSDLVAEVISNASNFGAGLGLTDNNSNRKYLVVAVGSGGFRIVDLTGSAKNIINVNVNDQIRIGANAAYKTAIGNVGTLHLWQLSGNAILVAGTVTVTNANITTNSRIQVTRRTRGGTPGICYEAIPAAGSFTINSYDGSGVLQTLDTSAITWFAVEP